MNENFETLFENSKYSQNLKKGQIVQANVIDITSDHAILNSGLKSESRPLRLHPIFTGSARDIIIDFLG